MDLDTFFSKWDDLLASNPKLANMSAFGTIKQLSVQNALEDPKLYMARMYVFGDWYSSKKLPTASQALQDLYDSFNWSKR